MVERIVIPAAQGVVFMGAPGFAPVYAEDGWNDNFQLAMDAQPALITTVNSGIPAFLTNVLDPEVVRVVTAPMRAAEIVGEVKKGDWTTLSAQFPMVEPTGEVSSYGDWNNNGNNGINANWIPRQSYHFQTISQYGERALDMYGAAKLNYKAEIDNAAALVINKYHNLTYFFGVSGLQNFGLLNDPSLIAPIAPTGAWAGLTAEAIFEDIRRLWAKLQTQMGGLLTRNEVIVLAMSPGLEANMLKTNSFGISVADLLAKNFPKLRIETAPEYATAGGELAQLIVPNFDGIQTAYAAFTEKLRVHPVVQGLSNFLQKKSAGTWGTIIRRPIAIAQMLGM